LSVVIAIEAGDQCCLIGCDSILLDEQMTTSMADPKFVLSADGRCAVGFCGDTAHGEALRSAGLPNRRSRESARRYVERVAALLSELRAKTSVESKRDEWSASFVCCVLGEVWAIDDGAVTRNRNGYQAIGAGYEFAMGALHAALTCTCEVGPDRALDAALEASAAHCAMVRGPFSKARV
jgi:ATP-dependent protease HslVU (ClpYQ) peptidase subunit